MPLELDAFSHFDRLEETEIADVRPIIRRTFLPTFEAAEY